MASDRRDPDPDFRPRARPPCVLRARRRGQFQPIDADAFSVDPPAVESRSYEVESAPVAGYDAPVSSVLTPGLHTTVQDLGRIGYQAIGVPVSGALDGFALRLANALVGNPQGHGGTRNPGRRADLRGRRRLRAARGRRNRRRPGILSDSARVSPQGRALRSFGATSFKSCSAASPRCCYLAVEGGIQPAARSRQRLDLCARRARWF